MLINCPECGITVSSEANECGHCRYPVKMKLEEQSRLHLSVPQVQLLQQTNSVEQQPSEINWSALLIVACIIGVFAMLISQGVIH